MLKKFKQIREEAGVAEGCIHDLRRTCITNWARRLQSADVQILAGHEDIQTTLAFYVEVDRSEAVERARRLDAGVLS